MGSMDALILRYGLIVVLLGTAVEGDVTMMLTGVTAHLGLTQRGQLAQGANMIHAGGDGRVTVGQRAVEVEENGAR